MERKGFYLLTAGILFIACNAQKSVDPGGGSYIPIGTERTDAVDRDTVLDKTSADTLKNLPDTIRNQQSD